MTSTNSTRKVALVTGASWGMGKDFCLRLLAHGYVVYGAARRTSAMADIADAGSLVLVRQYLADLEIGISETAFLLGYQNANSFYRAFRSWEGTTPAHWRDARGTPH
jgi:NAD(P)-dependent dehydrogenase (short-subunit alcohol dehydrogenase family)